MIIHYNCTIGSFSFLLIYHPYPPSFHEMIFILVNLGVVKPLLNWLSAMVDAIGICVLFSFLFKI